MQHYKSLVLLAGGGRVLCTRRMRFFWILWKVSIFSCPLKVVFYVAMLLEKSS
nr:hypothetical protein Iba_chr13cCG11380 [Ipomoea batatas]